MRVPLVRNWWSLVIRGVAGILFGLIAFGWPQITISALVLLFAAYAFIDGIFSIVGAVRAVSAHERWGALLIEGLVGIAAAILAVRWPGMTAIALIYIVAAWAILTGFFELLAAVRLRKHITGEWLLALSGVASLVFGVLVMMAPLVGALVIAYWIGAYAFVFGVLMIALGFRLRSWQRHHPGFPGGPIPAPAH